IRADLHDVNTVYVCLDNHKEGDYTPYLFKSTDMGKSWKSISSNIPDRHLVWRTVQDHVKPNLMFAATEFGIFFTVDGGEKWTELTGGIPTIPFRDITIQRRENDLVAASFGRGFFVLDDYSALRDITEESLQEEAKLFATRDALWYQPRNTDFSPGASMWAAENPPVGAVFTYYLKDSPTTMMQERKKKESALNKEGKDIPFPGWEALNAEKNEIKDKVMLIVKDQQGKVVRKINAPNRKGMHRVVWDFSYPPAGPVSLRQRGGGFNRSGFPATPGTYTVTLSKIEDGVTSKLAGPMEFKVKRLYPGALTPKSDAEIAQYRMEIEDLLENRGIVNTFMSDAMNRLNAMEVALSRTAVEPGDLDKKLYDLKVKVQKMRAELMGDDVRGEIGERTAPTMGYFFGNAFAGLRSTYGPTDMHKENLQFAKNGLSKLKEAVMELKEKDMPALEKELEAIGAPWIEGMAAPKNK
ncbi:MAG: glycosyl hydrolase, partial [Bacteroidota bacterium]